MKQIVAIVKPFLAERVIAAVSAFPFDDLMIREVKGYGRQKNYLSSYEDNEFSVAYLPKVEINVWIDDEHVDDVVTCIQNHSRTGRMGDGKIFVLPSQPFHQAFHSANEGDSRIPETKSEHLDDPD